jgi:ferric-dicitrate binding protein FerR (iron transport regulator)
MRSSPQERAITEAVIWMLRLRQGSAGALGSFSRWLRRSPEHADAFVRAMGVDALLDRVPEQVWVRLRTLVETAQRR